MKKGIGAQFMKGTRYGGTGKTHQEQGLPQPPLELAYPENANLIALPVPAELKMPKMDVRDAIETRKTLRKYANKPLTLQELSFLLWTTQGVKKITDRPVTLRTIPSAGARHAFETFLLINKVEGIPAGLYRYLALEHALLPVKKGIALKNRLALACAGQAQVSNSAVTFFWVAIVERMYWRYDERGYRYMHLDAGHVCQNLYLAAEVIDSGVCAIAAYNDEMVNKILGVDGENQFTIYIASLGKK